MLSIQRVTINYQDYFSKMKLKMFLSLLATHATDKYNAKDHLSNQFMKSIHYFQPRVQVNSNDKNQSTKPDFNTFILSKFPGWTKLINPMQLKEESSSDFK